MSISVFLHIYYKDSLDEIIKSLEYLLNKNETQIFINVCTENPNHHLIVEQASKISNAVVIKSPNKGKDIGGKLLLIEQYLKLKKRSDYLVFLHDKKSPQLIDGSNWKNSLFSIVNKEKIIKVLNIFNEFRNVGMIGAKGHLVNTSKEIRSEIFMGNEDSIFRLAKKFSLISKNYDFISGTMFWVRADIFEIFFSKFNPLDIRKELEVGNVMDNNGSTNTHSWERLFGWIVTTQNYQIKEV